MINGEAECSVLFHSVLVPPSKASAIVFLAIGVTVIESFMLGEEHDLVVDAVRCQCTAW